MPASKTVAREFVDSAFKPETVVWRLRLSVLKGNDLAPKALLQLQPGASPQGFDYALTSAEKRASISAAGFHFINLGGVAPGSPRRIRPLADRSNDRV